MKKLYLILILFGISLMSYSQIEIVSKNQILYGKSGNTSDYLIMKDKQTISDYDFAKLINDKRMVSKIEWNNNRPKRMKTTGKVMLYGGLSAIITSTIITANNGHSNTYWENAVICVGACSAMYGYGMMKNKEEFDSPIHYYSIEEAKKNAEIFNKSRQELK